MNDNEKETKKRYEIIESAYASESIIHIKYKYNSLSYQI